MLGGRIVMMVELTANHCGQDQMGAIPPHRFRHDRWYGCDGPMAGTLFGSLARMDQDLGKLVEQAGRKIGNNILGQQGGQSDLASFWSERD